MGRQASFHPPHGGADLLVWRKRESGFEIVYDDGVARHMVLKLAKNLPSEASLSDALQSAVLQRRILPALYAELQKRAIAFELVKG